MVSSVPVSPVCCRAAIEACTWPVGMSPGHPRHMGEESDRSQTPIPIPKQKQTPNHMMKERAATNRVYADMLKHHLKRPANESTELRCYYYSVVRVSTLPTYNPQASTNKILQTTCCGMADGSVHISTCVRIHALHHKSRFLLSRSTRNATM